MREAYSLGVGGGGRFEGVGGVCVKSALFTRDRPMRIRACVRSWG